jgi:DNA ligase D-like protein (predicted ligase)
MLPSLAAEAPASDHWLHEIKHDGYRTVLVVNDGKAHAFTRNRNDWTDRYAGIIAAAEKLRCRSAVIDGEVVVQGEDGRSDFEAVREAMRWHPERLVFFAFDAPFLNDEDLRDLELEERREYLRNIISQTFDGRERARARIQFSGCVVGNGPAVFAEAEKLGVEGIVSKRRDSRYRSGRTDRWRKIKCWAHSDFIVVGTSIDKRTGSPIALLAQDAADGLRYAGGAFINLDQQTRERFREKLRRLATDRPVLPELRRRATQWVKPELVVGVRHLGGERALRHATVQSINGRP